MRLARRVANALLRSGLDALDNAPSAMSEQVATSLVRHLAPLDFPLIQERLPGTMVGAVRIVARAVCTTPYGQPLRFDAPLIMTVGSTNVCPFACANCYADSKGGDLDLAEHANTSLFQRIASSPTPFVMIGGGEPMATPNFAGLLSILLQAGKVVYLSTNASLKPIIKLFAANDGQLLAFLPVWGRPEEHDEQRGKGSFGRVVQNLDLLASVGAKANVLLVLSGPDLSPLDTVLDLAKRGSVRTLLITRRLLSGRTRGEAFRPSAEFLDELNGRLRAIRSHVTQVSVDVPELAFGDRRVSRMRRWLGIPQPTECSAGNWMMHLDSSGRGFPCFSIETRKDLAVASDPDLQRQWQGVASLRRSFGVSSGCLAEQENI